MSLFLFFWRGRGRNTLANYRFN